MDSPVEQIKQFLRAVIARKRLFLMVSASVALLAVAGSFFIPKIYEATSTVFIEKNVISNLMRGITITPSMEDRIRVLRYYMVSRDIVSRTLKKMELDVDPRYASTDAFERLIQSCQSKTRINMRGNDLFFVSIADANPHFARDYINTLIGIYVEENIATKREESYGATRFLDEQLTTYKQKYDEIENKILQFRKETGIYSNVSEASIMAEIEKDHEVLKSLRLRKNETLATIKTIEMQLQMLKETTALGYGNAAGASGEDYRIEQLQAKINELLLVYNDKHPTVVKLRDQINELKKRQEDSAATAAVVEPVDYNPAEDPIFVDLKMRMNMTQAELNALSAKEGDLLGRIATNEAILRNYPQDKKTLNEMERERASALDIYQKLLQRVGISEVSKDMEVADKSTNFRIVDPAILPPKPLGTKRIILMLLGVLAGIATGFAAVFAAEQLNDSVKDVRSLKELGLVVLAEIPFILTEAENLLNRRRDQVTLTFASACTVLIGALMLHDMLGFSFIDGILAYIKSSGVSYRSPFAS